MKKESNCLQIFKDKDPITHHYFEGLKKRTFFITEEIINDSIDIIGIPLLEADNDGTLNPITIYINTPGGSLFDGFALVSIIEKLKSPTTIIVTGYACSMGIYFLMAGYNNPNITRKCYSFSIGLIHSGSQLLQGVATAVKDLFQFQERYEQRVKNFVLTHSNFTEEDYNKNERYELYLDSDEMLKFGLVDEII